VTIFCCVYRYHVHLLVTDPIELVLSALWNVCCQSESLTAGKISFFFELCFLKESCFVEIVVQQQIVSKNDDNDNNSDDDDDDEFGSNADDIGSWSE
jgi:hypothetical protein